VIEKQRRASWSSRVLLASTALRVVLAPVILALILAASHHPAATAARVAAVLFAAAALSDFADGRLARRWALSSPLGAFMDTTADKMLVAFVLFALVDVGRAAAWVAAIIVSREIVVLGLRSVVAIGGTVVEASIWGKLKASIQFVAILFAIVRPGHHLGGLYLDEWLMLAAALISVASGADYFVRFLPALSGRERPSAPPGEEPPGGDPRPGEELLGERRSLAGPIAERH
jgi:CDP-diacylglycerol--glycerol-3-phosphate 3-phosphatidyltransferase